MKLIKIQLVIIIVLLGNVLFSAPGESKIEDLIPALLSSDQKESDAAFSVIKTKKPAQLPTLLAGIILSNNDYEDKKKALKALQLYSEKKYLPLWINILTKTGNNLIKSDIIKFISKTEDKSIVMPLARELNNPFHSVRKNAILALKHIGDDRMFSFVLNMARNPDSIYRVYALEAIYYLYDRRFYYVVMDLLKDKKKSVRYFALRCIERNHLSQALSTVRNMALRDDNFEVRIKSIEILGGVKDYNSIYLLHKCLSDPNRSIRYSTVLSLNLIDSQKSAYSLSNQLEKETDEPVKELIIETLIKLKNGGGFAGLKKILTGDPRIKMRIMAGYALGKIDDRRAISILIKGLYDKEMKVRAEICNSLGNYSDKTVRKALLNIISFDKKRFVRTAALYSINRIKDKSIVLPLFDQFSKEKDAIFREKLRQFLRKCIDKYI